VKVLLRHPRTQCLQRVVQCVGADVVQSTEVDVLSVRGRDMDVLSVRGREVDVLLMRGTRRENRCVPC